MAGVSRRLAHGLSMNTLLKLVALLIGVVTLALLLLLTGTRDTSGYSLQTSTLLPDPWASEASPQHTMHVVQRSPGDAKLPGYTRVVCLSDTHGLHRDPSVLKVPEGDVLIFAGDAGIASELHVRSFSSWLSELPHPAKVVTFGNMDRWAASTKFRREALPAADAILLGESAVVAGLRLSGSPYTPKFTGSFQLDSEEHAEAHWAQVLPPNTPVDILVTHGPPAGTADMTGGRHVGDQKLLDAVQALQVPPGLWVVGHIHGSYGVHRLQHRRSGREIVVANVATADLRAGKATVPMVFDVSLTEAAS
eukprot:jgi/Ulvmu1/8695/UM047_0035.1